MAAVVKLNALKRVGRFSGGTDVERWIDRMELALRVDEIPDARHADVFALNLEGPAFDTWKGLSADKKTDVAAIKAELRVVFGLQRMEAWALATAPCQIAPGDTVDVAYEELRKLVGIASAGDDPVSRVAACLLMGRLPTAVRDRVLLQCGKEMEPSAVVECAKQLMTSVSPAASALVATADKTASANKRSAGRARQPGQRRCFNCAQLGHVARECTGEARVSSAVPGNGSTGQPQE